MIYLLAIIATFLSHVLFNLKLSFLSSSSFPLAKRTCREKAVGTLRRSLGQSRRI